MLSPVGKKEVGRQAIGIAVLGVLQLVIFALLRRFDLSVLWGTLLGCSFTLLSFVLLTLSVQQSLRRVGRGASVFMTMTYLGRLALTAAVVLLAIKVPQIYLWATVIPLLFPRIVIYAFAWLDSRKQGGDSV